MKFFSLLLCAGALCLANPASEPPPGLWEGYTGEWGHVSHQLIDLAKAFPGEKFNWRPAPGVRSVSEVFMHVAIANYMLLSVTGPPMPPELKSPTAEKTFNRKEDIVAWLSRSLDAVKSAHASQTSADLQRNVSIAGKKVTVDGIYLRIIVHAQRAYGATYRLRTHKRDRTPVV